MLQERGTSPGGDHEENINPEEVAKRDKDVAKITRAHAHIQSSMNPIGQGKA
jgi:hypothetical protein